MINKEKSRQRRARATRARIKLQKVNRLSIHRTNLHIYASIISADGGRVLVSASTVEREVRDQLAAAKSNGGNVNAAKIIGTRIAEKAKAAGIRILRFRPFRIPLSRPRCCAGRGRARSRSQVLRTEHNG